MPRWTDLADWRGPTVNSGDGDGRPLEAADALAEVRGLVVHIAEGFFEGTIGWQLNASAKVSSHFIAGRAGGRAQLVDTHDRAWTQSAGNTRWLSVECEGFTLGHKLYRQGWHQLTPQQIEFIAQLFVRIHTVHGVPLQLTNHPDRPGLGYHSMGAEQGFNWGHPDCPGGPIKAQLPQILSRAIQIANGEDDMSWTETLTAGADGGFTQALAKDWMIGTNIAVWNHVLPQLGAMAAVLEAVAKKVDLDPAELEQLKAAAEAGAKAGAIASAGQLAAAVAEALTDELGLTPEQAEAAAELALRRVLGGLDKPASSPAP